MFNKAWAFASLGLKNNALFAALAMAAEQLMKNLKAQGISNTVWAFASLGYSKAPN